MFLYFRFDGSCADIGDYTSTISWYLAYFDHPKYLHLHHFAGPHLHFYRLCLQLACLKPGATLTEIHDLHPLFLLATFSWKSSMIPIHLRLLYSSLQSHPSQWPRSPLPLIHLTLRHLDLLLQIAFNATNFPVQWYILSAKNHLIYFDWSQTGEAFMFSLEADQLKRNLISRKPSV